MKDGRDVYFKVQIYLISLHYVTILNKPSILCPIPPPGDWRGGIMELHKTLATSQLSKDRIRILGTKRIAMKIYPSIISICVLRKKNYIN